MSKDIKFILNGNRMEMSIEEHWTVLHLLREELGLTGTKEGCGSGECGACTVIVDGLAVNSCLYLAVELEGKDVLSIEGLASPDGTLHPLQKSFIEHGGIQCGFCSPGMILSSKALLDENPRPTDEEIQHALAGNLCRCTGYVPIFESVKAVIQKDSEDIGVVVREAGSSSDS
ncbi:(2Fe-2S)-binding protein [Desulfomonile tiedjei]|uniref:Aerobic-type carbon monoxide dehydrogenase, small subunit CoxS/CutS-like protein n=1 Tax=Desulfomonile tiedjei (strain ATCC 49306 / DSM 6799 / DCB-1) TaxID=706587 RepID=I4C4Q6_DESTA|nr:(2Fe-2S)-binding protein [Desulfomonile tiedjei]AFM24547.1 aerobic-type carbon monoxide dehydrogenase, small subunit CoxS/CutS-like protein [Desulfomonile tiedjei DSM 6799]